MIGFWILCRFGAFLGMYLNFVRTSDCAKKKGMEFLISGRDVLILYVCVEGVKQGSTNNP